MKIPVGVLGAACTAGQNYISLLREPLWFEAGFIAAPPRSADKEHKGAVAGPWQSAKPYVESAGASTLHNAAAAAAALAGRKRFLE